MIGITRARRVIATAARIAALAALLVATPGLARAGTGAVKGVVKSGKAPGAPVAGAVVMIEGPALPAGANAPHATIDQKGDAFVPRVLVVPVGTTVDFPNSDPRLHNVYSTAPAKKFDLGMYGQGESKSVTFDAVGVVPLRCNVHPKMEAYVVVHANPYAAVTDADGGYTITGVPAGSYDVRIWHERLAERTVPVTVRDGQVQALDVRLEKAP